MRVVLSMTAPEGSRSLQPPATATPPASFGIELQDVHYALVGRSVFDGLTLRIASGEITAVMGPSGIGKTTLLRLITGELRADRGEVLVGGRDVGALARRDLLGLRLRMGVLFQQSALFTDLDVFENVAFPLREHTDLPESLLRVVVLTKLHAVGLRGAAHLMPSQLSGGMERRVALARAIVMDPPLLLCDEPFVGLDPISTGIVIRILQTLNAALRTTIVLVSHDVEEVQQLAHNAFILTNGSVAASGRLSDIRHGATGVAKQFLGGLPDGPVPFHYPAPDYYKELLSVDQ